MKTKLIEPVSDSLTPTSMPVTRDCVADIREIITRARRSIVRHVNATMTLAYWLVGRRIVVEEQQGKRRAAYGEHLLERVSLELTAAQLLRDPCVAEFLNLKENLRGKEKKVERRVLSHIDHVRMRADVRREAASLHADARRAHFRDRAQSRSDWRKEDEKALNAVAVHPDEMECAAAPKE